MSFKDILKKPIADIKAPPPMPIGTYDFRIKSHEFVESGKKKTPGVQFNVVPTRAHDDVSQDELKTMEKPLSEIEKKLTFWISEDSAFRLREFLENDLGLSGPSLDVLIPQAVNTLFAGYVNQRPSEDNTKMFSEITKTAKAA